MRAFRLEAVLKGIDDAFEKWRSRKNKRRNVNSLAYCAQAVMEAAQRAPGDDKRKRGEAPFSADELRGHLTRAASGATGQRQRRFEGCKCGTRIAGSRR